MSWVGIVFAAVLSAWLVLTVLNQFRRGEIIKPIRDRDVFALIPSWTFFAPHPATSDVNVLVRDEIEGVGKSPWRELDDLAPPTLRAIWNPDKRGRKAVFDLALSVSELPHQKELEPDLYPIDLSYLTLLNYVMARQVTPLASRRQFMIARSRGYASRREPEIAFISWFHRV